jgi:hypothetical protein
MAIITDNGNLSTPKIKPGASVFFNRDGTITGKAGYTYNPAAYTGGFSIGAAHPYDANAFLAQFGETFDAAGFAEMDGDYVGVWSTTNYMVDGIAATQQEPIETNPVFVTQLAGTPSAPITGHDPHWDSTTRQFLGFGANSTDNLCGVTAYLSGGFVVRITFASTTSSDVTTAIDLLGVSSDTVTAGIITYSYSYFAFLCTNVSYKEIPIGSGSATFTITTEYTFTPPNGWNQLIYQTAP